jgi:hypothetical protein
MKTLASTLLLLLTAAAPAFANVIVSSPTNNETLSTTANYVASATTTTCAKGVAAMGVYVDNRLAYVANGTSINTSIALTPGKHDTVVQEWDFCGGVTKTDVPVSVAVEDAVWVTSPVNKSTVSWLTNYVATATSNCPTGVAAMGVYVNNVLAYKVNGAKLNTQINLGTGSQYTVVQAWDNCGGTTTTPITLTVKGALNTFSNIQATKGWLSWAQLAPTYQDCDSPCNGVTWSMNQGVKSPSLSGNASQVNLGGTTPYSDVLYANHLIGPFSTQGLPDLNHAILSTLHNFTYDAYFYVTNAKDTQAMEFDINWFMNTVGMTWGTECRIAGGNEWDIWDNADAKWVPTGTACNPLENQWNHVTVNVERGANNTLIYHSITLNGVTSTIEKTYLPFTVPADWYGITVNYQMDGDQKQASISSYVDNLSFMYW